MQPSTLGTHRTTDHRPPTTQLKRLSYLVSCDGGTSSLPHSDNRRLIFRLLDSPDRCVSSLDSIHISAMTDATPPDDQAVQNGITEALSKLTTVSHIRPNKLRKLVCKSTGATWTQFQSSLEQMIGSGSIKTKLVEGEKVVLIDPAAKQQGSSGDDNNEKVITIEVPLAVAHHLTRKGRRKQKNIESTTKTKLVVSGTEQAKKPNDLVKLDIIKEYGAASTEVGENASEAEETAIKHLNAAQIHMENMIKSYKAHPDRFTAKRAGGTLSEQKKAKKLRVEGAKRRAEKHQHARDKLAAAADVEGGKMPAKKKKQRKFY